MSQERQRDVRRKYDAKPRSCGRRRCEVWPLHDSLDDHLTNRSRSLRPTNGAKGLQRRDLLRDATVDAKTDETIAEGNESGHRIAEPPPSGFGRERAGVGKQRVGQSGD